MTDLTTNAIIREPVARAPGLIRMPGPLVKGLLRIGMPMGPNVLITVRGRVSGEPRTQPLAVARLDGRRWVIGTFGDTNWCRNMRANPDVELRSGRRAEQVTAKELSPDEAEEFFRDELPRAIKHMGVFGAVAGKLLIGMAAPDIKADPAIAATQRPVFELVARVDRTARA